MKTIENFIHHHPSSIGLLFAVSFVVLFGIGKLLEEYGII